MCPAEREKRSLRVGYCVCPQTYVFSTDSTYKNQTRTKSLAGEAACVWKCVGMSQCQSFVMFLYSFSMYACVFRSKKCIHLMLKANVRICLQENTCIWSIHSFIEQARSACPLCAFSTDCQSRAGRIRGKWALTFV